MLNYIWLALLLVGILVAVGTDWHDLSVDRYQNGKVVNVSVSFPTGAGVSSSGGIARPCQLTIAPAEFRKAYGVILADSLRLEAEISFDASSREFMKTPGGIVKLFPDAKTPSVWKEIKSGQKDTSVLTGRIALSISEGEFHKGTLTLEPVRFAKLNAVTNDGIIRYAKTAVELAFGLIGLMAVWLGLMKVAEQAGMVAKLAALLRPLTTRLFPDVPPDHPAMGAMIMNISANMLGLSNAATPLGLKAMEELNKLSRKAGTATDAMCTFLVINTSNVQLIPATVIAIRSAAGSANPTEIIGAVLCVTTLNLIVSVTVVKLMARLPHFRKQLVAEA